MATVTPHSGNNEALPPSPDIAQKLTDWKNEPSLQTLTLDLQSAKPSRDLQVQEIERWNDLLKVRGEARPKKVKGRSSVQPKLIRRQAEWRYSALTEPFLSSDKLFKISPANWSSTKAAEQNEMVLNWQFRTKMNRVKFIDDFVRSVVDEGTGIIRLGWHRVTTKIKQDAPEYSHYPIQSQEQLQQFQQALQASQSDPDGFQNQAPPELQQAVSYYNESGQATVAVQTGTRKVEFEKILENRPTATILDPRNFFLDPSCNGEPEKAMFAIVTWETCQADLKKEQGARYKNLDQVDWEGNAPLNQPDHYTQTPTSFSFQDPMRKKVVVYEYWGFYDINGDGTLVPFVAAWIGSILVRMELNPFPDQKLPFVIVPYMPRKRESYGEPDAELLEENQAVLGAVMRGMIDLMGKSANGQHGFAKGMLDPMNRRRYEEGKDYEFNPNMPPQQGLIEHTYPEIPQSAMLMTNLMNQEAEALTGVKSFSGGMSSDAYGNVATGIRGLLDAASKREMAILRRLAHGMSEIGEKIISMNGAFLSEQEVVPITQEQFVTVSRDDLAGEYSLEVDISTAEVDNAQSQDLAFMLQTLGPKGDWGMVQMILAHIAKLKRMPDLAHQIEQYQPQPDPNAAALAQAQVQVEQKKLEVMQSQIDLNEAQAKALGAKADMDNLNYVEQETGTKHARDMQKQQAQAEGNQNLEVTKALLQSRKQANGAESKPNISAAVGYNALTKAQTNAGQPGTPDLNIPRDNLMGGVPPAMPATNPPQQ